MLCKNVSKVIKSASESEFSSFNFFSGSVLFFATCYAEISVWPFLKQNVGENLLEKFYVLFLLPTQRQLTLDSDTSPKNVKISRSNRSKRNEPSSQISVLAHGCGSECSS